MARKRGAPKGNRNAQKHGFYSRAYTALEGRDLARISLDIRQDYFNFYKVVLSRTVERIKPSASNPLTFHETLTALQTVVLAIHRLHSSVSLTHSLNEKPYRDVERLLISLKSLDFDDDTQDQDTPGKAPLPALKTATKRGGQPGNNNAVKHGLFASYYSRDELHKLANLKPNDLEEEISLLQVLMKRVFIGMQRVASLMDYLKAVRVLARAGACLDRIRRIRYLMVVAVDPMAQAYKQLSTLPFEED
ncbi:hypothetical protein EG829_13430 [bacterium]|nr:hypothetical protein [bacterium]